MNIKQYKNIFMGVALVAVFAAGYLTLMRGNPTIQTPQQAQQTADTTRTVKVSGQGQVQAKPDTAVIRLGVQTDAKTAQAALNQNNDKMQALVDTLKKAKIASENIQTQTIRLSPRYENNTPGGNSTLTGYTASNIVEVRTKNLESLGTLLDQSVKAGANTIENISFEISDSQKLTDQARQAAVENAQHKAEQLAKLTGASLGPIQDIQETSNTPGPLVRQVESAPQVSAVPVSPGSQNISVDVQMTWTLISGSK